MIQPFLASANMAIVHLEWIVTGVGVMSFEVREAVPQDVGDMVELSEQYRLMRAQHQPVLWSKAEDSREKHLPYLDLLVRDDAVLSFVHHTDGGLDGFVIGTIAPFPPVYAGGLTCNVEDFCVANAGEWQTVGRRLLDHLRRAARGRRAVQVVVVCPHFDAGKRAMLTAAGLTLASEWYTVPL